MFKRVLAAILTVMLIVNVIPVSALTVQAEETEYEIYPTPQRVEYQGGTFSIGEEVNVIFEEEIDEVTQNKLVNVLSAHGIAMDPNEELADTKTNILVGVKDSDEFVDQYADENVSYEEATFADDHYDAYVLDIDDGIITVLGNTTDGAFYGIVTLMHILNQIQGGMIRNLTINDYADTAIRGFIEGYYGIPWSNEDRMSLMKFGGQFKMTSYIFAPKDDEYHKSKWRELYPESNLKAIQEMVEVGQANKCRFVWTAHPFMGGFDANDLENEIASLLRKFDQLYSIGVRQFGVLGDDVGSIDYSVLTTMMTAVSEWAKEKGDVYDSVFCPAGYNHSWQGEYAELNALDAGFPEDVQIFWTGEAVCQPVETVTLDHFRNYNATNGQRRAPLFWLNWPVNDINAARMLMGKGSLLHTDVDVADLAGVVTNPMQEAETSKVALFAVADYAWNVKDFDDDQSWKDSFKYIEADATEELYTLAKHMSDPSPNNHGLVLEESAELQPLLDSYKDKLKAGTLTEQDHATMLAEFEEIAEACDNFHLKSRNEAMKDELLPFTNSLKDQAMAAIEFIKTQQAITFGDENEAWNHYSQATAYLASSKTYTKPLINSGITNVAPSAKRITPFVETLSTTLAPIVNSMIDDTKVITTFITNRTDTPSGNVNNILDGDVTTGATYKDPNKIVKDDYVGVKFSKAIEIHEIRFVLGAGKDHFDQGKLQYTMDGTTWKDLVLTGMDHVFNGIQGEVQDITVKEANLPSDLQAMGIRFVATKDNAADAWLEVREIMVNTTEKVLETEETVFESDGLSVYSGSKADITDGDDSTYLWYSNNITAGQYIGLDLGAVKEITGIHFAMDPEGDDYFADYKIQCSVDNITYEDLKSFTTRTADIDLNGQNKNVRYVRVYNNADKGNWLKIASLSVTQPKVIEESDVFANLADTSSFTATVQEAAASLSGTGSVTLKPGEYVGLDLERIKDISHISIEGAEGLTLEVSKNNIVWTLVTGTARTAGYEDARYIRLINHTEQNVETTIRSLTVESYEIQPISVLDTSFGDERPNGKDSHLYAFDGDRTTEAVLMASQLSGSGQYIIYDLGQEIALESLKLVFSDSTTDYPRHAKVSVSADQQTWTDIMFIGNQDADNEGEADNTDNITQLFPVHEISYNTKETTNIDQQVRYIKFELTRNKAAGSADKWVRLKEIELNGGNMYLPDSNDPTILTDAAESKGNTAANMKDGDLSTTFQPVGNAAGFFTYSFSDNTEIKRINILQSPATVSNAAVTAEVYVNGQVKEVTLGKLSESFNKFNTSAYDHVLSITVTWKKGNVPCIQEIITLNTVDGELDKSALYEKYNEVLNGKDENAYTVASWAQFKQALNNADSVLLNSAATADEITAAIAGLESAANALTASTAKERLVELYGLSLTEEDYTDASWSRFAQARTEVADVVNDLGNKNDGEIAGALTKIENAYKALVTKQQDRVDQLNAKLAEAEEKDEEVYTPTSWSVFKDAFTAAQDALNNANSADLTAAAENLKTAMAGLVERAEKSALQVEISLAPNADLKDTYTSASWKAFEEKLAEAKKVLNDLDASSDAVSAATKALTAARNGLVTATDMTKLQELYTELQESGINSGNYTEESWAAYKAALQTAKIVIDQTNTAQAGTALEGLQGAYADLVTTLQGSINALKAKIAEAEEIEQGDYTAESWEVFREALKKAKFVSRFSALKKQSDIDQALQNLTTAIASLAAPADKDALDAVIALAPAADKKEQYTSKSWAALETALKNAKNVSKDSNATAEEVGMAKTALQAAINGLVKRGDKTDLTALVNAHKNKSEKDYTEATWKSFKTALDAAQAVLKDKDATIQDVTKAKEALEKAAANLKEAPKNVWNPKKGGDLAIKLELEEEISSVSVCKGQNVYALSADQYEIKYGSQLAALFTARSGEVSIVLKESCLKTLNEKFGAGEYKLRVKTVDSQEEVEVAVFTLAADSTNKPSSTKPSDKPSDSTANDSNVTGGSSSTATTTVTTTTATTTTSAKTGDDSNAVSWMMMITLCGAAYVYLRSKKQEVVD